MLFHVRVLEKNSAKGMFTSIRPEYKRFCKVRWAQNGRGKKNSAGTAFRLQLHPCPWRLCEWRVAGSRLDSTTNHVFTGLVHIKPIGGQTSSP
ncbi:hypothetical protein AVEN_3765-1 [Araneus ventricosus]|uniref:Uncharacterized protein n=1 Tax=Araneus ventricosus TaxID=182803 RepID=A0A4Y2NPK4_ARAVE|nr:hypothetical protein AVEN_3765-1 [Araneus ventricosus]